MDPLPQSISVWSQRNKAKNSHNLQMLTEPPLKASQHELTLFLVEWTPQEMIISERTNLICLMALQRQSFIYF